MSSTDLILKGKYPAKAHAKRVADYLQTAGYAKEGVVYLESQKTRLIEDNDEPVPFRYGKPSSLSSLKDLGTHWVATNFHVL